MQDSDLDDLFAQIRAEPVVPSEALIARVLSDAAALQPRPAAPADRRAAVPRQGLWRMILAGLGGPRAIAGLATVTAAGVWIGFAQPAPVATLTETLWSQASVDSIELIPSLDGFLAEG
jgi:hypothetical protein